MVDIIIQMVESGGMTILVTGARGAIARHVVRELVEAGESVRVASKAGGEIDGRPAVDPAAPEALAGVRKVFTYADPPTANAFLAAAKAAGVEHVVLLSSATVTLEGAAENPIAQRHAVVEKALVESGIPWTFIRPGGFAANARNWWAKSIRAERVVRTAFPEAGQNATHERDMAAVSVRALLDPGHEGVSHLISGPESLTQREMVEQLSAALGEPIRFEKIGVEQYRAEALSFLPPDFVDFAVRFYAHWEGTPSPVYDGVEKVLGRPAIPFSEWAAEHTADFLAG